MNGQRLKDSDLSNGVIASNLLRFGEARKWHLKYAKFNKDIHQSLLSHSLNVLGVSMRILTYSKPTIDNLGRYRLLLASFFHDVAKETEAYQTAVKNWLNGKRDTEPTDWEQMDPTIIKRGVSEFISFINSTIDEKELDSITWIITHMAAPESVAHMQNRLTSPPFGDEQFLSEIGQLSDRIMSMRSVEEAQRIRVDKEVLPNLKFDYYKLGIIRGVLTQYLHKSIQKIFEKSKAIPIAWFPDGTLYATDEDLQIKAEEIQQGIRQEFSNLFAEEFEGIMGESSFGTLTASPIKSPEFLFVSENSVRAFWKRVMRMNFTKFQLSKEDLEKSRAGNNSGSNSDMLGNKRRLYNLFLKEGEDELNSRVFTSDAFSISQIIQILNYAKNLVIKEARKSEKSKKKLREEIDEKIIKIITSSLKCVTASNLSSISQGSPPEERFHLFKDLTNTELSREKWKNRFDEAVIESTILIMHEWKQQVDDPLIDISKALTLDVVRPSNINQTIERAKKLEEKYCEGKNRVGTSVCEECGNIAEERANSPPFEKSETYHDHLAGGQRYGKKNVINVCKLCRFEREIRSLFIRNGEVIILYPQLALSPSQRDDWDKIIKKFALDKIGNYDGRIGRHLPPITSIYRWAEITLEEKIPTINPTSEIIDIPSQNTIMKALSKTFEDDLKVATSYLEEDDVEYENFGDMALALYEGRVKLNSDGLKKLNDPKPEKFLYGSPNFILVMVPDISKNEEPSSATSLRLIFLSSVLAKLFAASVSHILSDQSSIRSSSNSGYVQIQRYPSLQKVYPHLGIDENWVPISELDKVMTKLAGLLLADGFLKKKGSPSYGRDQIIKISSSLSPGQVLNRSLQDSRYLSSTLIRYLQFWNGS